MKRLAAAIALAALGLPGSAAAQVERYDLGRKLVAFDRAWDAQPDPAARRRALPVLKQAVPLFFAGKFAEAARTLDQTRFLLRGADPPAPAERWAAALAVRPSARLFDPAAGPLAVEVVPCYDAQVARPNAAGLRWAILPPAAGNGPVRNQVPIPAVPSRAALPVAGLAEGDYTLRAEVVAGGAVLATHEHALSAVPRLRQRLEAIRSAAAGDGDPTAERLTLRSLADLLGTLAEGYTFETNYPAARLLAEAEALAAAVRTGQRLYGPDRAGQFWLTLPAGRGTAPVRLQVPKGLAADKPVPLVVALHGAGGSENLFFDAYGAGAIARQCEQRGWLLVATRAGGLLGQAPPVAAVIDELARRYPVDPKRVYLVGHSLGAMHAVDVAQAAPGRVAAVAALGGGGTVRKPDALKGRPVFVACGAEDFALGWARGLAEALEKAGADVRWREYPDVEHVAIVQDALKDVFAFFEANKQ
jgi:predicted esterase